jgi:DNA-binding PadR family transcriptional regulator
VRGVVDGALSPALYRWAGRGWIAAVWGGSDNTRRAGFYRLPRAGRRQLRAETDSWQMLAGAVARILEA